MDTRVSGAWALVQATNRRVHESQPARGVMRIDGFFLGLLLLNPAVLGHIASSQDSSQPALKAGASPSQRLPNNSPAEQSAQPNSAAEPAADIKGEKPEETGSDGDHKLRVRLGTISVGAGYTHFSGPTYYPYEPYGFYPYGWAYSISPWYPLPGFYPPFYAPGYFAYGNDKGEVKLAAEPKTANVYLDRAYAGTADRLKSMWLDPGAYDLSVSSKGLEAFHQRIYVLSGKSLRIKAKLIPEEAKERP